MKLIDILVQELPKRGGWPEGATSLCQGHDGQIEKLEGEDSFGTDIFMELLIKEHREWAHTANECNAEIVTREQYEAALKQSAWDGTGLPPVGVECEYTLTGRTWFKCKVEMYVGSQGVVMSCDVFEGIQYVHKQDYPDLAFRPIRSEAERKRDESIEALHNNLMRVKYKAEEIYNAIAEGKIPGIKLEKE